MRNLALHASVASPTLKRLTRADGAVPIIKPRRRVGLPLFLVVAAALWSMPVLAQPSAATDPNIQRRPTVQTDIDAARERSRRLLDSDGPDIRYADVLADPDNAELNYRFAQQQIRRGDLKGAVSTLDRILVAYPDLHRVRLLYASVLLRLDALPEAEREFRTLLAADIAPAARAEITDALAQIERRRNRTRWTASTSIGVQYDTNRDSAPRSKTRLFADVPLAVGHAKPDAAALAGGSLRVGHALGAADDREIYATVSGSYAFQNRQHQFDLAAWSFESGVIVRGDLADITAGLVVSHAALKNSQLLRAAGLKLRAEKQWQESVQVYAEAMLQYQNFDQIHRTANGAEIAPTADELTGARGSGAWGELAPTAVTHSQSGLHA
jgi:tetratricopeptide (TPR) repeat protein